MRKIPQNLETLMQTGFFGANVVNLHQSGGSEFCCLVLMIMTMMMNIKLVGRPVINIVTGHTSWAHSC